MEHSASTTLCRSVITRDQNPLSGAHLLGGLRQHVMLALGVLAIALPTLVKIAMEVWAVEEGAHGPIVLASGAWLLFRMAPEVRKVAAPGSPISVAIGMAVGILAFLFGRMVGILGVEAAAIGGIALTLLYGFVGGPGLRCAWFPLLYLAFLIPLPDTFVALITQPLKLYISMVAAGLLSFAGYPVANTGVTLQIAQYELLVAAACSGLNALVSLSAIGLFYVYLLHRSSWRYAIVMIIAVVPAAIFANFMRVVILILITYHFGDAAAQGFLHSLAGLATFVLALAFIIGVDALLTPLRRRLSDGHG